MTGAAYETMVTEMTNMGFERDQVFVLNVKEVNNILVHLFLPL